MVILDSNIIIDHIRQLTKSDTLLTKTIKKGATETFAISIISIQELYQGKSTLEADKEEALLKTLSSLQILSYDFEVAKLAGEIFRDSTTDIKFADSAIAATCLVNGAKLLTLNTKDFAGIKQLTLYL